MKSQGELARSGAYLKRHSGALVLVLALVLAAGAVPALEPLLHRSVFERLVHAGSCAAAGPRFYAPIVVLAVLVLVKQALELASAVVAWRVRLDVNHELLEKATAKLHDLPLSFHHGRGVGETMTRLDRGITSYVEALSTIAFQMLPAAVYVVVSLSIMLALSPVLALVALAFVVPPAFFGQKTRATLADKERALLDRWCAVYNRFQEVLSGIKTVKAFAREREEHRRFVDAIAGAQSDVLGNVTTQSKLSATRATWVNLGRVAVLAAGAGLVAEGSLAVGTLVAFLGYVGGLYGPAQTLLALDETLRRARIGLGAMYDVLDADDAVPDPIEPLPTPRLRGDLEFDRASFKHHPNSGSPLALDEVSFKIRAGEYVAVVGPSGAGKSTLADLVLRLYDPIAGSIRVDGLDLRSIAQRDYRRQVGVVPQEPFLFDDTALANLRYGAPDASIDSVMEAARDAQAHEFLARLPNGYDTKLGRGGVQLSGGEKQRLAIARTILKHPSIVILDEPTSALDVESELLVQRAIDRLAEGRTTLVVAHRLSTIQRATRLLVLDRGRLVDDGAPKDLLARGGAYRRMVDLWRSASGGEIAPAPA